MGRAFRLTGSSVLLLIVSSFSFARIGAPLQSGGNTIAGPGVFSGGAGDSVDVYQAQSSRVVCVTLRVVKGSSSVFTDGTVPPLMASVGATISGCGEASVVTISCDTRCTAEWRVDGEGNVVIENIDVQTEVQVVGVVGPPAANADPACADHTNRYVDCGNGTVTDTVTGLIWLENANCFGSQDWASAINSAAQLEDGQCGLSDGSKPGDWRLPTRAEWDATIARAVALGCTTPSLTNIAGKGCHADGTGAFSGMQIDDDVFYWSSSSLKGLPGSAWIAYLNVGNTIFDFMDVSNFVWPVRGGQ